MFEILMPDQAHKLRELVHASAADSAIRAPLVVVAGARMGVGATRVAIDLATGLCRSGRRAALVDGDFQQPSIATRCGIAGDTSIDDVLSGGRTLQEVLVQGPAGVGVVPGTARTGEAVAVTRAAKTRLVDGLRRMANATDVVVLDVGSVASPASVRFWRAASLVVLVATDDAKAALDAYAAVKLAAGAGAEGLPPIAAVICARGDRTADDEVQHRLATACRRFLGLAVEKGPTIRTPLATAASESNHTAHNSRVSGSIDAGTTLARFIADHLNRTAMHSARGSKQPAA